MDFLLNKLFAALKYNEFSDWFKSFEVSVTQLKDFLIKENVEYDTRIEVYKKLGVNPWFNDVTAIKCGDISSIFTDYWQKELLWYVVIECCDRATENKWYELTGLDGLVKEY